MLIEVIQEDIDMAECHNIYDCIIARTFKRYFPDKRIVVGVRTATIGKNEDVLLPDDVANKIAHCILYNKLPKPFSFELNYEDK